MLTLTTCCRAPSSRYQFENLEKTKILPFFHLGLNEVYPPVGPHERTFRSDKAITMLWGEPISFENEIEAHKAANFEDELSMIESITKRLQVRQLKPSKFKSLTDVSGNIIQNERRMRVTSFSPLGGAR